jgi:sporulation protein YlmC with PRC-barrel domain
MHFTDPTELGGLHVIGRNGVILGVVKDVYADIRSGYPQWAAVQSGLFGADVSIIPLTATEHDRRSLHIPYSAQELRDAPHRAPGTAMSHKEEANLFRHYGVGHGSAGPSAGKAASPGSRTSGVGRTMLHRYAVSSAIQMS